MKVIIIKIGEVIYFSQDIKGNNYADINWGINEKINYKFYVNWNDSN